MGNVVLDLKLRENEGEVILGIDLILQMFAPENDKEIKEGLYNFFSPIAKDFRGNQFVHDAFQLKWLIRWGIVAQKPYTEQQKFDRLLSRLERIDITKPCKFPMNDFQVKMILSRLAEPDFIPQSAMFYDFARDFMAAIENSGRQGTEWEIRKTIDPGWKESEGEIEYIEEGSE